MSTMSEQARSKAKSKVERLVRTDPKARVDASGYTPPGALDGDIQTGMRPISRRAFKSGGKVLGDILKARADRKPRASGGRALVDDFVNRDVREANKLREGIKHEGGFARGGKAGGGLALPAWNAPVARASGGRTHGADCTCAKCSGGRVKRAAGGSINDGIRPAGGRLARKGGGRTKGKGMNVNIIIAPGQSKPAMPPPGMLPPPGGGPPGLHQGMPPPPPPGAAAPMGPPAGMPPMGRKRGGKVDSSGPTAKPGKYPIESGAGEGLGRLEKARAYGA
jgi:hypothetical protein